MKTYNVVVRPGKVDGHNLPENWILYVRADSVPYLVSYMYEYLREVLPDMDWDIIGISEKRTEVIIEDIILN